MDDFEVFKTSVEAVTRNVAEIATALELETEPEDVTELGQSHHITWWGVASYGWAKKMISLEMESTDQDAMNNVEMTTKNLEYHANLVDKAVARF